MSVETEKTYSGSERRIDPENRRGLDFHSARALRRFENISNPEARRSATLGAQFRNTGAYEGEADATRTSLITLLNKIEGLRTPEQEQLLKLLSAQISTAVGVWTKQFPIEGAPCKNRLEQECRKWLSSLSDEVLQGFLELCPETTELVVVPPLAVPELLKLINAKKTFSWQTDSYIWWPGGWNGVKSDKWKFGLTNGAKNISCDPKIHWENPDAPEDESISRTNEQIVDEYERLFNEKGLNIMPQHGYVPSCAKVLVQRRVLDRQSSTAFKRPGGAVSLPFGGWGSGGKVGLGGVDPVNSSDFLRCRPWVEGDMSA